MGTCLKPRCGALPSIALVLLLSACGGGGGGGGGVVSTPTPTPAPAPAGNADLVTLTKSESFTNNAVRMDETADATSIRATSGKTPLTISYDASTGSYTLSSNGVSETFTATDKTDSTDFNQYQKSSAGQESLLSLTKPGTSGSFTYRYVGAGLWEVYAPTAEGFTDNLVGFTYGVETPDSARPTTGRAAYAIDLLGASPYDFAYGAGALYAYFDTGKIEIEAEFEDGDLPVAFIGQGTLSSGNGFNGTFETQSWGDGVFDGRFYGPGAEEVGATFTTELVDSTVGFSGVIVGRKDSSRPFPNESLLSLARDDSFQACCAVDVRYAFRTSDGAMENASPGGTQSAKLWYYAGTKGWTYSDLTSGDFNFTDAQKVSNGNFLTYDNGTGQSLSLFKSGPSNGQIALTYTSFLKFEVTTVNTETGITSVRTVYQPYGMTTKDRPTSGSAQYSGIISGKAVGNTHVYALGGTTAINVQFGTNQMTGSFAMTGADVTNGQSVNFGSYSILNGYLSAAQIHGGLQGPNSATWGPGTLNGAFFGPAAAELAGSYTMTEADPLDGSNVVYIAGAFAAKK